MDVAYGRIKTRREIDENTTELEETIVRGGEQKHKCTGLEEQKLVTNSMEVTQEFFDLLDKHVKGKAVGNLTFEVVVDESTGKIKRVVKYWTTKVE